MSGRQHPHRDPAPLLATLPEASRRDVLRTMAASLALAAAGCDGPPPEAAVPYVEQPEHLVPGRPLFYATAVTLEGFARPVLAEVHEGRPTRLDGNPRHPAGTGASDPFMQAEVLNLYDPDRPRAPLIEGEVVSQEVLWERLAGLADRLAESGGVGCRMLSGRTTSPTLLRQREEFLRRYPQAGWHVWDPLEMPEQTEGIRLAFGRDLALHPRLGGAAAIVSLGADPLGPGPTQVENGAEWAVRRAGIRSGQLPPAPMMVAEATPSLTGLKADSRLAAAEWKLPLLLAAIAQEFGEGGAEAVELTLAERAWTARAAQALRQHAGASLLLAGPQLPAAAQALAHRINHRLGNLGRTLLTTEPVSGPADAPGLAELAEDIAAGRVRTLILLESNPLYAAPANVRWAELLARVPLTIHAGRMRDETGMAAGWQVPLTHPLESWSDARHPDGTASIVQPTIRPLFGAMSVHQFLAALSGDITDMREPVRETWRAVWGDAGFEERWNRALRSGYVEGTEAPQAQVAAGPATFTPELPPPPELVELVIRPDPTVWDGSFANNAWLQELPKPLTKVSWTNVVGLSPALAGQLGLREGDLVEVEAVGRTVVGAAYPLPGQSERTVTLWLGYGRAAGGRNGSGLGYNAARLRPANGGWRVDAAALRPAGDGAELPLMQKEGWMNGLDLARKVPLNDPRVETPASTPHPPSVHPDWDYPGRRWAMAVDVDNCIGCNACMVACQAENSIPTVGPEEVKRGRALHWIRVERYWTAGDEAGGGEIGGRFLPVLCMHCEKAPCEVGCPVNATVHGPEGLNQMIYNRCIGTRTCAAYCPYEVRRFNYFDYAARDLAAAIPQRNPDVTVRARGVMEKCTYCVQRIRAAEIQAGVEGRDVGRDEITTACAAACPSSALIFGDLNDPDSPVARRHAEERAYDLLRELGTRPRTFYLAAIGLPEDTA